MAKIRKDLDESKDFIVDCLLSNKKTLTELCLHFNCKYDTLRTRVKKWIPEYKPDYTSHLNKYRGIKKWNTLSEYVSSKGKFCKRTILYRLLSEERGNHCSICGIDSVWNNKPLRLQVDHINGLPFDNSLDNIRLVCPNCHSQTENFSGSNKLLKPK